MGRWLVGGVLMVLVCAGAASPAGGQKAAQPPADGPKAAPPAARVEVEDLMRTHTAKAPVPLVGGGEGAVEVSATAGRRTTGGRPVLFVTVEYFYPASGTLYGA